MNLKFKFQYSVILKIGKPFSFMLCASASVQKQKSKLYFQFCISIYQNNEKAR